MRCAAATPTNWARRSRRWNTGSRRSTPTRRPVEDCYSALQWLVRLPPVDRSRVAIGGASAGGGLAAALALLTRDRGEISLAAQLLVYPMLDDRTVDRKGLDNPGLRLWNQSSNRYRLVRLPRRCGPARWPCPRGAKTSAGCRLPGWASGTFDLFHDEDLAYAERLEAAGVRCEVEVVPGAFHAFDGIVRKPKCRSRFSRASALCCGRRSHPRRPRPVAPAVG